METRRLGKTGEELSVIGLGATVFVGESPQFGRETVARAIDEGISYFDMGPTYGDRAQPEAAEVLGGPAIQPYRDRIFLAEKTRERTKADAAAQLRESLTRMRTDHFDLYQLHNVSTPEEVDTIVGPDGALEALVEARELGLARFLGFSAHTQEAALALMDHFEFDTILFPVNYVSWYQSNFGPAALERAQQKGMGILALKALAKTPWQDANKGKWTKASYSPVESYEEAKIALRWTLSRPVTACVSPGHAELFWWMIEAEKEITALTPEDEKAAELATAGVAPIFPRESYS